MTVLTAKRPYLLRAYYDWLVDNELTPYLVVDAFYPDTQVPDEFVKDGQIVLNISPNACGNLLLGNQKVTFNARFKGVVREVVVPLGAALAIYARENGEGVLFESEETYETEGTASFEVSNSTAQDKKHRTLQDKQSKSNKANHLKIIK